MLHQRHRPFAFLALIFPIVTATGCTNEPLEDVDPVEQTLEFSGDTVDVRQQGMPVELASSDREDVSVSYRVSPVSGTPSQPVFEITDGVLELRDPCPPMVFCDVRFEVEVPEGVTVLRDGEPTDITGD